MTADTLRAWLAREIERSIGTIYPVVRSPEAMYDIHGEVGRGVWRTMGERLLRTRVTLVVVACASGLACVDSPGPPTKATSAQIDQMNQEIGAASSNFAAAPDWAALAKAIRDAANSADRLHWISEFARHAVALPESLRTQRLAELRQLTREVR